jgi:hypothetical protein
MSSSDHTQPQSAEEQELARDLSRQKVRPPTEIPGYTIQRLLGAGAYGEVWIGVDRNTNRRVAIKFYTHRSRLDWSSLSREVEKLVFLSADRYIVQLLDVGWDADPPYYVMDYIENGSLEDLLQRQGTLRTAAAVELFREVSVGLLHAHGKGVLHCDLKPANVLLDEDNKPRLADFGQSRLSHEQSPALGTLFYMAPEQADLNALPDSRWDVYALGAIIYRMLVGEPPFRTDEALRRIEEADDLAERLSRYQHCIRTSPRPTAHRRVRGVDRLLAEIVERCLEVNPSKRFPNVQAVLDALHSRERSRLRRPLVLLGFVGPVLLLLIVALFGLRGYDHAVRDSEDFITFRAHEANDFAAKFAARSIEGEIERYFLVIRDEADSLEFYDKFEVVAESKIVQQLNAQLTSPDMPLEALRQLRTTFLTDTQRCDLNAYLESRLAYHIGRLRRDPTVPKFASVFALDAQGRMLAAAYDDEVKETSSVGWNYAFRTYFHGRASDVPNYTQERPPGGVPPLQKTHLSAAFLSTSTGKWKVAVSTPVYEPGDVTGQVLGVLAFTVNLGDFAYFRSNANADRFAVLIDAREGSNKGVILQHPHFDRLRREGTALGDPQAAAKFRLTDEQLRAVRGDKRHRYSDPMGRSDGGELYAGDWIAAVERVRLPDASDHPQEMVVLVQQKAVDAIAPVKRLAQRLKREGLWALLGILGVVLVLWYIVMRMLQEPESQAISSGQEQPTATPRISSTVAFMPRRPQ